MRRPSRVVRDVFGIFVDAAVDFENQLQFRTIEVHYEAIDHMLTTKLESQYSSVPHNLPDAALGYCRFTPEVFRKPQFDRVGTLCIATHAPKVRASDQQPFPLSTTW